ncbi:sulfotransferase [Chloroflexia bacterium SDU3-3]|nr:sulfotransferase [Chloroflexia bacterium SDU3-3]
MRMRKKIRAFLSERVVTRLGGLTASEWLRLLVRHRFAVDAAYWPRAALISILSVANSIIGAAERAIYGARYAKAPVRQPIFILGHWRSGTTMLYRMLVIDERFCYPTIWQSFNPHTFLLTEGLARLGRRKQPKTRRSDGVQFGSTTPAESESATMGTLCSPALRGAFPRQGAQYDQYLTFRGVAPAELARWKHALLRFYQKLSWKNSGRPILIKLPSHTGRIKLLLEMFPDARFIHICRNPYSVFQSTKRKLSKVEPSTRLQDAAEQDLDGWIIQRYQALFQAYFEEKSLIPEGQLYELRYEDLEQDPLGEMRRIYQALSLPDFAQVEPQLRAYVASLADYQKNTHEDLPEALRARIAQAWHTNFERWGYPQEEEQPYEVIASVPA